MTANRLSGDTTMVAIGDSAMWTTGTDYRFKTPNLVHKLLNGGTPLPPVQFRARGGAVIGRSNSTADGTFDKSDDDYGFSKWNSDWWQLNSKTRNDPSVDEKDVNNLAWSIKRDLGKGKPTILEQLDQFANWSKHRELEVPWHGNEPITLYHEKSLPDPSNPSSQPGQPHTPSKTPPDPETVDLVLVNGSTNDIGLEYLMDFRNSYYDTMEKIEQYSYRDVKHLLKKTRERFPNALVVLVGYPIFLSEWSSYHKGKDFLRHFDGSSGSVLSALAKQLIGNTKHHLLIERVIDGGMLFGRAHQHYMRKAAAEWSHVEAREGHPGVMYVSRGFGVINAYEGPDPWGWSHGNDDTFERRRFFLEDLVGSSDPMKLFAAIGHPNRKGSIQTAKAIVNRYRDRNSLSVRTLAEKMDRRWLAKPTYPKSLKDALESTKSFPNSFNTSDAGSVRHSLSHRIVDSIQLRFHVDTEFDHATRWEKMWRTTHLRGASPNNPSTQLYLDVEPGRNGSGESFRVDYESDKNAKDTPQFDKHANNSGIDRDGNTGNDRVLTEVNIDPMAGRQMNGTVNTNYGKDRTKKEDNVKDDSGGRDISWSNTNHGNVDDVPNDRVDYQPGNRWDTDRLKFWHLWDAAKLRVKPVGAPGAGFWALRKIELTINGELTWTTTGTNHGSLEKTFKKATENNWGQFGIQLMR